ncbi:hypothetical protein SAMN02910453_0492 [Lachnospiraceae bacterium A10]|nr:hypothetical protein SAMN02910453_0492 [Lachnospiraceae bacterium A10]
MMSMKLRVIMALILLLGLMYLVRLIKKRKIDLKYSIVWLLLPIVILVIILIPGLLEWVAAAMGIYDVMNMVFFLGFIFVIAVIFSLTVAISKLADSMRQLTQKVALEEYADRKKIENEIESFEKDE